MLAELKAYNGFPIPTLCDMYLKTNSKSQIFGRLSAGGEEIIPGSSSRAAATTVTLIYYNMTEPPKLLVNVEYVLFDMDGLLLLLINNFF
jgi:hypothetical protein